jgi:para-nitrobenzyl esterase
MVWIYGGAFVGGATSFPGYSGEVLAKKGVVVVSLAYRVGALGFLAHPQLSAESPAGASGNYGLMDLIAGLKWVKRNIAQFGGDPGRVTIFGESAGATAVGFLAASPKAKGLFQGAISESGGIFAPPRNAEEGGQTTPTLANAERRGAALLAKLGVKNIAEARKLPADQIVQTAAKSMPAPSLWPVLDGDVIPDDPYKLYQARKYNNVPVLAGTNSDEGALFVQATTVESFKASLRTDYGPYADALLAVYPANSDQQALRSDRDLFRDTIFGWPTWTWARLQTSTGGRKVFLYYFRHRAPRPNAGVVAGRSGAVRCHLELLGELRPYR